MPKRHRDCDFSSFLRGGHGLSKTGRAYKLIGVMTAKYVLRKRTKFDSNDVKLKRGLGVPPNVARSYVGEFLSAFESPGLGHSFFAEELVNKCPALHTKVLKYWHGW